MSFPLCSVVAVAVACLVVGCTPERQEQVSEPPEVSPTLEPGPYLGETTWRGLYLEYWDEHVEADTFLNLNVESQENGRIECLIYHLWGFLRIDGMDVPDANGVPMSGTYRYPGLLDLSGEFYGYSLEIHIDFDIEYQWMSVTLDLEQGYYLNELGMAEVEYIPFEL